MRGWIARAKLTPATGRRYDAAAVARLATGGTHGGARPGAGRPAKTKGPPPPESPPPPEPPEPPPPEAPPEAPPEPAADLSPSQIITRCVQILADDPGKTQADTAVAMLKAVAQIIDLRTTESELIDRARALEAFGQVLAEARAAMLEIPDLILAALRETDPAAAAKAHAVSRAAIDAALARMAAPETA